MKKCYNLLIFLVVMPTRKKTSFITVFPESARFFKELRWPGGKKKCVRCESDTIYTLKTGRLRCKGCGLTFGDFTGTYLGQLNIPINETAHLLYLFSLGLPVYRCRHYITISMKTAHKAYTLFRRAIYDQSVQAFNDALKVKPDLKEALRSHFMLDFLRNWEADDRNVFFGIVVINGTVYTFPIRSDEKSNIYISKEPTQNRTILICADKKYCIGIIPVSGTHLLIPKLIHATNHLKLNTKIESFWTYLNEHLFNYHGVSISHYSLYIKEIEFRFNNRTKVLFHPIAKMIVQSAPKVSILDKNQLNI